MTIFKELAEVKHYPTSDTIGDWLRRPGVTVGEKHLWDVIASLIQTMTGAAGETLDIESIIIEAEKGDAQMSFKGVRGYHLQDDLFYGNYIVMNILEYNC